MANNSGISALPPHGREPVFSNNQYGDFTNLNHLYAIFTTSKNMVMMQGQTPDGPMVVVSDGDDKTKSSYQFIKTGPNTYTLKVIKP